jgi:hypothetical protein
MIEKLKKIFNKKSTLIEKVASICIIIYLSSYISFRFTNSCESEYFFILWQDSFLKSISFIFAVTGFSLLIISGIFEIRKHGFSFLKTVSTCFFIFVFLAGIGTFIFAQSHMKRKLIFLEDEQGISISLRLLNKAKLDPFDEEWKNRLPAKSLYTAKGEIVFYPDINGNLKLFEPTEEEKIEYKEMLEGKHKLIKIIENLHLSALIWIITLIASIGIGILYPLKKKISNPQNITN